MLKLLVIFIMCLLLITIGILIILDPDFLKKATLVGSHNNFCIESQNKVSYLIFYLHVI